MDQPLQKCLPVAAYYEALLLSQLNRHGEALEPMRRFGFRYRIAPQVWALAHDGPGAQDRTTTTTTSAQSPVHFFADAVPPSLATPLRKALCPNAAFWSHCSPPSQQSPTLAQTLLLTRSPGVSSTRRENDYSSREYFSFFYDVKRPPSNVVEQLIRHLLPKLGRSDIVGAEWVHTQRHCIRAVVLRTPTDKHAVGAHSARRNQPGPPTSL